MKKQHNNELQKAKNALTALADKVSVGRLLSDHGGNIVAVQHALQLAELKAQHEREKEQQLSDALMAVADVSDLNVNVPGAKGKGSAPPTPTPSAAAAASPPSPVRQTMAMEPVEIPAPAAVVVVKKPSSTGFYLGVSLFSASVYALCLSCFVCSSLCVRPLCGLCCCSLPSCTSITSTWLRNSPSGWCLTDTPLKGMERSRSSSRVHVKFCLVNESKSSLLVLLCSDFYT